MCVRTVLSPEQYAVADTAHMTNGAYVRVTGRLYPGCHRRQLSDVQEFTLLDH